VGRSSLAGQDRIWLSSMLTVSPPSAQNLAGDRVYTGLEYLQDKDFVSFDRISNLD